MFHALPVSCFVLITFLWSWSIWFFLILRRISYDLHIWKYLYVAGLTGPLVASVVVTFMTSGWGGVWSLLKRTLIWRFSVVWYLISLFLIPLLMIGAAQICVLLFQARIDLPTPPLTIIGLTFAWMIVRGGPANEEVGWRGFLLPKLLERYHPFRATLVLIPIWAVWHWPLWLLPGLPHKYWPFACFFLIVAALSFLFTWLHLNARGSILIAILFHGAINTAVHFLPMVPPRYPGLAPFAVWIGLTWAVTLAVLWTTRERWFSPQSQIELGVHAKSLMARADSRKSRMVGADVRRLEM
jgi:membrane protease YdiL (CAAX protease family)